VNYQEAREANINVSFSDTVVSETSIWSQIYEPSSSYGPDGRR
jgi:hypothetical protein